MSKNVLLEFEIDPSKSTFLKIASRPSGLLHWLLTMLHIAPKTTLIANRQCLDYRDASLFGFSSLSAPLNQVTAVTCGVKKSFWLFLSTIICFILGTLGAFALGPIAIVFLIIACILGFLYYTGKNFCIGFMNGGDTQYLIRFHSSIIEGVKIDQEKVEQACALMRSAILQHQQNNNQ